MSWFRDRLGRLPALARKGLHYTSVIDRTNFVLQGVGAFRTGLMGVRTTERSALLARKDLPKHQLKLSDSQQGGFQHGITLPTINGPVTLAGGWLAVDARSHGKTFRFISSHLSAVTLAFGAQAAQMQELLAGPAATNLDVIIAAELNSTPGAPAYAEAVAAGFTDEWALAHPSDLGNTAFQVLPTINNPTSTLSVRIDDILARGHLEPSDVDLVSADPSARTPSGLWPSDHAGVVATVEIDREPDAADDFDR